jgi:hypothetical protein
MSKNIFTKLKLLFLLNIIAIFSFAQEGTVRGFVYEKETSEAVIFTTVSLKGTKYGAQTDVNGYFSISKVPRGNYTLVASALNLDSVLIDIEIKSNEIISKKIYLPKKVKQLKELVVSAAKEERKSEVKVSVNKITIKELKKIPTVGGEPDLAQYLQVLPGVIFTGDQGGQLYIRGGSPVQNKVLLDGMIIYNPFHSIGLFSVFDADIIKNADVYTGGFGAQYGGRISSVMDITSRDGNKKRVSGKISASTFGSKVSVEGPLIKDKEEGNVTSSYLFSAKNSYLSRSSKLFYTYADSAGLPFDFTDLYGKVSLNTSNGSKINVFGFRFQDDVNYPSIAKIGWLSSGLGSNFVVVPGSSQTLIKGSFAYSKYNINLTESDNLPRTSDVDGFNMTFDFTNFVAKNEVNYGIEALGFKTGYEFTNTYKVKSTFENSNTELAGFIRYKMNFKNLILDPSFRIHYYASLNEPSLEPRLGLKWNITDDLRFKAAGGIYAQNLLSASSDRDVVNLFFGFLSSPDNLQTDFTNEAGETRDITSKLQRAWHAIAGFEYDLGNNTLINLEFYNKQFFQLININRNKKFEDTQANRFRPASERKDFIIEEGYARGIDFNVKYDYRKFYLWFVYSLGYVTRYDGELSYMPHFDRRHNLNIVGSYNFGKRLDWDFNIRWNYGSGFPFTRTQGVYELLTFENGVGTNYTTDNGTLGRVYGNLNQGRLPSYHRMDINIKKKFSFSEHTILEVSAGVTNAYNRRNIFYKNRDTNKDIYQLPILPSISMNLVF